VCFDRERESRKEMGTEMKTGILCFYSNVRTCLGYGKFTGIKMPVITLKLIGGMFVAKVERMFSLSA